MSTRTISADTVQPRPDLRRRAGAVARPARLELDRFEAGEVRAGI
jgi:hypothetical protein